jgi:hypothetical protein
MWLDSDTMSVSEAIHAAEALLPGEPTAERLDPRWQAIIAVGEYIESEPEAVWSFICRWGCHPQEDLRAAIATCLLEHLLEHHFAQFFPRVEKLCHSDQLFADTFGYCWQFGDAEELENRQRFAALEDWIRRHGGH